ncbi:MAG: adenosine deaminase, partial [Deltaproteobacteria bacterium]|nr:adenosine deaminase [Deltaproteobacteria bacterium]
FIYCRFHCPSKKPLIENTRFFFSKKGAENAGFRPCKRCRPEEAEKPSIGLMMKRQRSQALAKQCQKCSRCATILNPVIISQH